MVITYTLPGSTTLSRVLDRRARSYGRDKGWELVKTSGAPPVTTVDNQVTYDYSTATGFLDTVTDGNDTFTYGYQYTETGGLRIGATGGTGLLQGTMAYTVSRSGTPSLQTIRAYEGDRNVLDSVDNRVGGSTVSKFDYAVNAFGQREQLTTTFTLGGSHTSNAGTTDWDYDDLGQVTSADAPNSVSADRSYSYDTIGNRKRSADSLTLPGSDNYTANALNQYTAVPLLASPAVPVYDTDGNATGYPVPVDPTANATLVWDAENRLISATVDSVVTTYLYDPLGRRIARTTGTSTTAFIYDGWNCIGEYTGTLLKTRIWGLDLSGTLQGAGGVGGLLAEKQGGNTFYPTYDGNGNISEYLDETGAIAAHFEYDPFGNTVVNTDTSNQFAYRFSTKPLDQSTGLYYYGYRWYDPITGRWPSRDPIQERGGLNLYVFVGNNGLKYMDYLGLIPPIPDWLGDLVTDAEDLPGSLYDNLVSPPEPYEDQNQLDTEDDASVEQWKTTAKNEINSRINCTSKPDSVDGYYGGGGSAIQTVSRVSLSTEAKVSVMWDNTTCCWSWSATLTASNEWGASAHAEFGNGVGESAEWLLWGLFPAISLPVGEWEISDDGCCDESSSGSP